MIHPDPKEGLRIERTLAQAGHLVVLAASASLAKAHIERVAFQAALVFHDPLVFQGVALLRNLRERQPACLRLLLSDTQNSAVITRAVNEAEIIRVVDPNTPPTDLLDILHGATLSSHRNAMVFSSQMESKARMDRQMLSACLNDHRLRLAVQPIVRSTTTSTTIVGHECLLRSQYPGLTSPLEVLRAAESSDRVEEVGQHIFALAARWLELLPNHHKVFINLHPHQLTSPERLEQALIPLRPHGTRVVYELTERSRLHDNTRWRESLFVLQNSGAQLAIDDLGAGYNSLSLLADVQPHYIKLDMSLVRDVDSDPRKQRLIELMSTFARATQASLIGEGVETLEERMVLMELGVELMQGYHFARPQLTGPPRLRDPYAL